MNTTDALQRAAANLSAWHATSVEALGWPSTWWPGIWSTDGRIPAIYLNAIISETGPASVDPVDVLTNFFASRSPALPLVILDSTNSLDLRALGLVPAEPRPCFWRVPAQTPAPPMPSELEIVEVRDEALLAEFEATSSIGFGVPLEARFGWHAPHVLADPRFRLWLGRVGGRGVGATMAYVGDDLIGVYGVTVVPEARRLGYGAALTWQATTVVPELPAVLQPSDMAVGLYERLGYRSIGHFTHWHRRLEALAEDSHGFRRVG